jgi:hypothetical protein
LRVLHRQTGEMTIEQSGEAENWIAELLARTWPRSARCSNRQRRLSVGKESTDS